MILFKRDKPKKDNEDVWFIDPFQFENILQNGQYYFLIDLTVYYKKNEQGRSPAHEKINLWLKQAHDTSLSEVLTYVKSAVLTQEMPLLLICDEGKDSLSAAQKLSEQGYINVYALRGGVMALLQYLE